MAKYFSDKEIEGLDPHLVAMLDDAREFVNVPFVITSGFRSPEQNAVAGGVKKSDHMKGLAVDIRAPNEAIGKIVAFGLGRAGFTQFVAYTNHIHVSINPEKGPFIYDGGKSH